MARPCGRVEAVGEHSKRIDQVDVKGRNDSSQVYARTGRVNKNNIGGDVVYRLKLPDPMKIPGKKRN